MATLTAPEIQRYCEMLSHRLSASFHSTAVFDARTYQILDKIFDQIKQVMPRERDYRRLGFMVPCSPGGPLSSSEIIRNGWGTERSPITRNSRKFGCPAFLTRNIGIPLPPLNGKRSDIEEFFLSTE